MKICEYCKNEFSSKKNLNTHQTSAKYCLKIQGKNIDNASNFECFNCNKKFTLKSSLATHEKKCAKNLNEIDILKMKLSISEQKNQQSQKEIEKTVQNAINEVKSQIFEKLHAEDTKVIHKIALQPKTTNNTTTNNNKIVNLAVFDINEIKTRLAENIENIEACDLYEGQISVARILAPCLQNPDGQKMITCSDFARSSFSYKDQHGNINRDIKCLKLANEIEPIVTKKANSLIQEDYEKREKCREFTELKSRLREENILLENMEEQLNSLSIGTKQYNELEKRINEKQDFINEIYENYKTLEYDGATYIEAENFCDVKLVEGSDDIKGLKKNPTKFAKELSMRV
jgi:hypothetical protein